MKFEWETLFRNTIDNTHFSFTDRAKVHGGWIVNNRTCAGSRAHESSVFVPDPNHEWNIVELNDDILKLKVDDLGFEHNRTVRCLRTGGVKTLEDLLEYGEGDLLLFMNFGQRSLLDVRKTLKRYDIKLDPQRIRIFKNG